MGMEGWAFALLVKPFVVLVVLLVLAVGRLLVRCFPSGRLRNLLLLDLNAAARGERRIR
jgi:hypothetical protein